jgi:phosphoribosyl 1,2-cyclic phosphodiesterase
MKIINPIFVKNKRAIEGIFLGTGTSQGIPVIGNHPVCKSTDFKDRLRVSVWITWDDYFHT